LQQTGRLEVLSRPQVLAVDNTPASINVGERVPLITSSRVTDQGDTINTITYENIGLTLDVLPRIGSDGTIQMEVQPTISSVGTQSTPISEFARAVFINNRSAETTVTCYDGQTVIIGGLIQTTDQDMEDKIPLLGDMPGLGLLFRRIEKVKVRDELMIFLTPRILRNAEATHEATLDEFRRNDTLRSLKTNHAYKEGALDMIREPDLRDEIRKGSNRLPTSAAEVRRENMRQTIQELELLPERWQPYGDPPADPVPGQQIPRVEAPNPPVEPGEENP
jgi:general secretion pathway protein D